MCCGRIIKLVLNNKNLVNTAFARIIFLQVVHKGSILLMMHMSFKESALFLHYL
jgi:hypothetical protein